MTTTTLDTPVTHTRTQQVSGLLVTLAGRRGWLLWWPLLAYVLTIVGAWTWFRPGYAVLSLDSRNVVTNTPLHVLLISSMVAIGLLWALGARHALAQGYDRTTVFGWTTALSFLLPLANYGIAVIAHLIELSQKGTQGPHIFGLAHSHMMAELTEEALGYIWFSLAALLIPTIALTIVAIISGLRWGPLGFIVVLGIEFGTVFSVMMGFFAIAILGPLPAHVSAPLGISLIAIVTLVALVMGAQLFRSVRA